ncbi:uncharacterized protein LOC9654384 [Selaginella moellendorffii]|uniref:uncharacterized protein LOC9654384 n=1 Tax=Selaginella moellendorffii TaxID=88036 RepID=UPI000D1CEB46|nr:uncharacterized protein LOC9654384 [Selaginella moellendorffii]|eukprot:XP_024524420.1 uncharacterized protein LOC9654384 [Selaginella moellendorffii]
MATTTSMASLASSMAGLSLGFSSSSGWNRRLAPLQVSPAGGRLASRPCTITMTIRKWELKKLKEKKKMHVRLGDTVKVISGSDKGKVGEVTKLYRKWSRIIVKDVNMVTKHMKPKEKGESGQILQVEAPIHSSNVQLYSISAEVVSRVGHKVLEDGTKVRYLIKTGEVIDSIERWKKLRFRDKDKDKEKDSKAGEQKKSDGDKQ